MGRDRIGGDHPRSDFNDQTHRAGRNPHRGGLGDLILQSFWLMPFLSARTDLILQGQTPEKSNLHAVYVVLEMLKAGLLGYFGFRHIVIADGIES